MNRPRTVEGCPHRADLRNRGATGEVARCRLVQEITGIPESYAALFDASRGACEACVTKFEPSLQEINSVIASLLFGVAQEVVGRGGVAGCDVAMAERLRLLAKDNLEVIMTAGGCGAEATENPEADACFYRGGQTGDRDCPTCRGSVRSKVFQCFHERHTDTTIAGCRRCNEHEAPLEPRSVKTWSVGVTVAPRENSRIGGSLKSLAAAGWESPRVFAEPETALPGWVDRSDVTVRRQTMGAWPNWLLALTELVLTEPQADAYLMCQDDVLYCGGLREYLEGSLWPSPRLGVVSLHCASHQDRGDIEGFFPVAFGWGAWGAQAYVFSNASARALLRNQRVVDHRRKGPADGLRNIDSVVGQWCLESGLDYFLHSPSLTQHVGDTSTIWEKSKSTGRRRAATFVGEESDVRDALGNGSEGALTRGEDAGPTAAP